MTFAVESALTAVSQTKPGPPVVNHFAHAAVRRFAA